jgi:hypothetical protein
LVQAGQRQLRLPGLSPGRWFRVGRFDLVESSRAGMLGVKLFVCFSGSAAG